MAITSKTPRKLVANLVGGETAGESVAVDYLSNTLRMTLHNNTFSPNYDTLEFFSAVGNELATALGYTDDGEILGTKTVTYTAANSWGTAWAAGTAYAVGQVVKPVGGGNGHLYRCIVAGTSHAVTEPTWPTVSGQVVVDNTVTWAEVGAGITVLSSAAVEWAGPCTFTAAFAVIRAALGGGDASDPVLLVVDFGGNQTGQGGVFRITPPATGWFHFFSQ